MKVTRASVVVSTCLIAALAIVLGIGIAVNHRFADDSLLTKASVGVTPLRSVLIIGDSWAANGHLAEAIAHQLASRGIAVQIASLSYPGKRTGTIFESISAASMTSTTCVIIAGVNDSIDRFGRQYYAHNIRLLAQISLLRGCAPVVVDLPRIDQEGAELNVSPWYLKVRNLVTCSPKSLPLKTRILS